MNKKNKDKIVTITMQNLAKAKKGDIIPGNCCIAFYPNGKIKKYYDDNFYEVIEGNKDDIAIKVVRVKRNGREWIRC